MKISNAGLSEIKFSEGLRLTAYRDTGGVLTIGYGHTSAAGEPKVYPGMTITEPEAHNILARDVKWAEDAVMRMVKVPLTQGQFDALVSFTFNLGEAQVSKSTLIRKLNAGDYVGADAEFARWVYDDGKKLAGLVSRREREDELFDEFNRPGTKPAPLPKPRPNPAPEKTSWVEKVVAFIVSLFRKGVAA